MVQGKTQWGNRYDIRGFGRSSPVGAESYSSVDGLRELLRYLNTECTTVIGLSMGGGIASAFAVAYPNSTRALVLVDALVWGYQGSAEWGDFLAEVRRTAREDGVAAARERWLSHEMFVGARAQPRVIGRVRDIAADSSGWHWLNRDPERELNPPTIERIGDIQVPTLVVVGERDAPDFLNTADVLAEQIPRAQDHPDRRRAPGEPGSAGRVQSRRVELSVGNARRLSALWARSTASACVNERPSAFASLVAAGPIVAHASGVAVRTGERGPDRDDRTLYLGALASDLRRHRLDGCHSGAPYRGG
jgi:hypothetical protein